MNNCRLQKGKYEDKIMFTIDTLVDNEWLEVSILCKQEDDIYVKLNKLCEFINKNKKDGDHIQTQ